MNLEEQYDKIFRYLYFHLHDKHTAEDLTQETFLRFLKSRTYQDENRQLQYLYTIARNLCRQKIMQRMEKQGLSEAEMAYWDVKEADVHKHFRYHYHSGPANLLKSFQALGFFVLLSVITQNALAVTCGLLGYLIVDLFAVVPDRFRLLQMIWSLRPNEILMNTSMRFGELST